jgi:hypothetical protein
LLISGGNFINSVVCLDFGRLVAKLGGNDLIYSEKYKVLFVSVPKTGTTSLTAPLMDRLEGDAVI